LIGFDKLVVVAAAVAAAAADDNNVSHSSHAPIMNSREKERRMSASQLINARTTTFIFVFPSLFRGGFFNNLLRSSTSTMIEQVKNAHTKVMNCSEHESAATC
jgi:hypothetical protein